MQFNSIRTRLTLSLGLFFLLLVVVAGVAVTGLSEVTRNAKLLNTEWLVATETLGEISDQISEFRLSETYRALARTPDEAAEAENKTSAHAKVVASSLEAYRALVGKDKFKSEVGAFLKAWSNYERQHKAWVDQDAGLQHDDPARPDSMLHQAYKQADEAIDRLIDVSLASANAQAAAAESAAQHSTEVVALLSLVGAIFTLLLIGQVRIQIANPLATITAAAARLASGSREIRIPEIDRQDEIGEMAKAFEVFRSNATALEEAQRLADSLARHDALTGLPNRRLFASELESAIAEARGTGAAFAIMLVDLDRFKPVNDLQGHAVGDMVLCEVARRLEEVVGKEGTVARLGGDEFAVIARTRTSGRLWAEDAIRIADKIVAHIREPLSTAGCRIEIGASIGIATCPLDGMEPEALIRAADLAMYRAKQDGRGTFRFFEQSMDQDVRDKAAFEADFRAALESGQITPFYQPLVDIDSARICGFELLARWRHPTRGPVTPDVFVPLAEQLGLIGDLTASILRQGCRDARAWDGIKLALNISPSQFQDAAMPAVLLSIMLAEGFPPHRLEVEVTESALVGNLEAAKATLQALQQVGIKVALDDFGTGYSSLYHLREMKFDKIKIDRSFVHSMTENPESAKIVDAVLGLARSLGMPAVAEGIENADTMQQLVERGCEYGQGYLFSQAVPATVAAEMVGDLPGATKPAVHAA